MATKKESDEKKTTTKRKYTRKTTPKKEITPEELVETPLPDPEPLPEGVVEAAPDVVDEPDVPLEGERIPIDIPDPEDIDRAVPEPLDTILINEEIARNEVESEPLKTISTGEIPPKPKAKVSETHNPENDVMITTADFKPRPWGKAKKL